jgi:CRISPR-associated endonuclease Cas2
MVEFLSGGKVEDARMAIYLVAYDLTKKKPEFDYQILWDELERLGAHRTQFSAWLINADNTARELLEHLKAFVHDNDRLWIVRLTKISATNQFTYQNAMKGTNDWLSENPVT